MAKIVRVRTFNGGAGFQLDFDNGLTLSVGYGSGYYGSNYDNYELPPIKSLGKNGVVEAEEVEIAIFIREQKGFFITSAIPVLNTSDRVAGWVHVSKIPEIIDYLLKLNKEDVINLGKVTVLKENLEVRE